MIQKEHYPISGMMCASCAITVEKVLQQAPGVKEVSVNYANQKANITFDSHITSAQALKKLVIDAGYDMEINALSEQDLRAKEQIRYRALQRTFWGSLLCSLPVFAIAMFHLHFPYSDYLQAVLATIGLFFFGKRFFVGAYNQLKHHTANMDTLVALSTSVAYLYSLSSLVFREFWQRQGITPHLYFEAAVMIISFILLGKVLEESAKGRTSEAIRKLMGLKPTSVWVKKDNQWQEIPIDQVQVGDVLLVKAGQKIAVDGQVTQGETFIDESMITGESLPVKKTVGDTVFAGTANGQGSIQMHAEKIGAQTLLSSIIKAVEDAQASKPPVQKLVDKIAALFVPTVIAIALLTFFLWLLLDKENGFSHGLQAFVSVLVIACPCALGLATPTAIMVGIGKGAENGILIKDAQSIELSSKMNAVVLDKTGTITQGTPTVISDFWTDKQKYLPVLYSLELHSSHPLAEAITTYWKGTEPVELTQVEEFAGAGVQALWEQECYRVGSLQWIQENNIPLSSDFKEKIQTYTVEGSLVVLASSKEVLALIFIADQVKDSSAKAIKALQKQGIEVYMLTGDNLQTANIIAQKVGISHVKAQVKPADKQDFVKELQAQGKIVGMVGDGINDSQALAQADVSIAMGKGSDVAMEVAQLTIISSDLLKISKTVNLSVETLRTIRQNLFWAFIYNLIGIPIAAGVLYLFGGGLLNPMYAGAAMAFSSVSVVTNSLLLKQKKI
ncbi:MULTISPECIES: heavy metal translocating P-type ATPase [unclassified Capnocytophaga]|uniref:heavy metal translocating P-type ATPase n=1 Tax=unclassified Capnocytophaga TaxID=2640652 RepID=UPI000202DBDE|nr:MULTISPECIES: heavy metal translocating P-type ATPase [unclassified Capnocytophaga]EGD33894.1 copper-exporting ATPase [Capnocytophaga sp. oral taxon 338 str. F0234]MEB3005011.1 heavy metal translocating P-type ATPase [Capnocytophaga sp. G2]